MTSINDPIVARLARIESALTAMDKTIGRMAEVIERLTRIEERDFAHAKSLEKAWHRIDDFGVRLGELEKAEPMQRQTTKWVLGAVWGACGAAAMFILKKLGVA